MVFKDGGNGSAEIVQESHYYPFGMEMEGNWNQNNNANPENNYLYNGKELDSDFGLNWYHYGFRMYDPAIGRFTGVDPISDQFAWVSTYNYAENEPIANIDLHGLQKVSINDIRNDQGQITSRNVSVNLSLKVLNQSSQDSRNITGGHLSKLQSKASRVFSSSFNNKVVDSNSNAFTDNEVPINVKFSLTAKSISDMSQVSDKDHLMILVDNLTSDPSEGDVAGRAEFGGNVLLVEGNQLNKKAFNEISLHELGHNLGLDFSDSGGDAHTTNGKGLMGSKINGQFGISKSALKDMFISIGAAAPKGLHIKHKNTQTRAKDFVDDYSN